MTSVDVRVLADALTSLGYGSEIGWAESVGPPADAEAFARELIFVVVNSGMRFAVARGIYERIMPELQAGGSAGAVFGHAAKAAAIDRFWRDRETYFRLYALATDKIAFLGNLPWIGMITKFHAARNFGVDTVKPDIHLQRLADTLGTSPLAMCQAFASELNLRVGTVDVILWRSAALGILDSRTGELRLERLGSAAIVRDRERRALDVAALEPEVVTVTPVQSVHAARE